MPSIWRTCIKAYFDERRILISDFLLFASSSSAFLLFFHLSFLRCSSFPRPLLFSPWRAMPCQPSKPDSLLALTAKGLGLHLSDSHPTSSSQPAWNRTLPNANSTGVPLVYGSLASEEVSGETFGVISVSTTGSLRQIHDTERFLTGKM